MITRIISTWSSEWARQLQRGLGKFGMDYEDCFRRHLEALHQEGRYRVFADLKRRRGAYPAADTSPRVAPATSPSGARTTISAWASTRP